MIVKLKICGMRDSTNITAVAALQPDYMGFIFYDQSPRYVGKDFVMAQLPQTIKKVGVFVNEKTEVIQHTTERYKLDFVQLHGNEAPGQCKELRSNGISVIKAFSVDRNFNFKSIEPYAAYVTHFLFDTKGKNFGGNATAFDWALLDKYVQQVPFFLSGGITTENVLDAKNIKNPNIHALDVNSGVEIFPGVKDVNKVREFKQIITAW